MRKIRIRYLIAGVFLSAASYAQVGGPGTVIVGGGGTSAASGPATALQSPVVIEGTADSFEGNFTFADPTADWTWAWGADGYLTAGGAILAPTTGFSHGTTPAYSFAGDTDTGIYNNNANNTINFAAGGSRRGYISSTAFALDSGVTFFGTTMYIEPQASAPVACNGGNTGYVYLDTSLALCFCDGTTYQVLNPLTVGVGACS